MKTLVTRLVVVAAAGVIAAPAAAQSATDPMAALLAEVHALRIAMEQQASVGPRIQLTLARLTIEEQRITHLSAELDATRQRLTSITNTIKGFMDSIAEIEGRLQIDADPAVRRKLEGERVDLQRVLRAQENEQQQVRA